jgi:sulfur dioxygenase
MIFKQFFDPISSTFTYLLAKNKGGEAIIIDPVLEKVEIYLQFLGHYGLKLVKAADTHIHSDHISGLGKLRRITKCMTIMGKESNSDVVSMRVEDGDKIKIDGLTLEVIYTPGHTEDSYCFYMAGMVFTGDTLLIGGTGRTDFQNGSSEQLYESLCGKIMNLPADTILYPGHDYKGETLSTLAIEKSDNPRLQVKSKDEFVKMMNGLQIPSPGQMDVALPTNMRLGEDVNDALDAHQLLEFDECMSKIGVDSHVFIDLREEEEIEKTGHLPNCQKISYSALEDHLENPNSLLNQIISSNKTIIFYCAYGERSALAVEKMAEAGHDGLCHMKDGIHKWIENKGPIER